MNFKKSSVLFIMVVLCFSLGVAEKKVISEDDYFNLLQIASPLINNYIDDSKGFILKYGLSDDALFVFEFNEKLDFKEVLAIPRGKGPGEGYQFTAMFKYDGRYYLFEDLSRKFLIYTQNFEFVDTLLMEEAVPIGAFVEYQGEILAFEHTYESLNVYRLDFKGPQASIEIRSQISNKYIDRDFPLRGIRKYYEDDSILFLFSNVTLYVFKKTEDGLNYYDQIELPIKKRKHRWTLPTNYFASSEEIILDINDPREWYRYDVSKKKLKKIRPPQYEIGFKFSVFGDKYHVFCDGDKNYIEELE